MQESALVVAQAFGTQAEAEFAKGALDSAGIDSMVQADTAGGMRPHLAWSGLGFRVLVREEDVAAARDVLRPPSDGELVLVQTYVTQDEADTALGALLSAGIAATIQDDSARSWRPDVPWSGTGFRVLVPKEDAVKAREVLERLP
jgi:Putative prokaryotic signal transducing protein